MKVALQLGAGVSWEFYVCLSSKIYQKNLCHQKGWLNLCSLFWWMTIHQFTTCDWPKWYEYIWARWNQNSLAHFQGKKTDIKSWETKRDLQPQRRVFPQRKDLGWWDGFLLNYILEVSICLLWSFRCLSWWNHAHLWICIHGSPTLL